MKHISLISIFILLIHSFSFSQSDFSFATSNVVLEVKPSDTDSRIKEADTPHLVVYDPSIKQGKLLLFMPGTGGIALKGPKQLFQTAVEQGYYVINLSYINRPAIAQICKGANLEKDCNCAEEFRTYRIYGTNNFPLIEDKPYDAIVNRLTKLLIYLEKNDPKGNWGEYLENGTPKWEQIALSGQSQGGGMAAFIAKEHLVARVIDFSGGWDFSAKDKIASWYAKPSKTPASRWYGTYHVKESAAPIILESYQVMGIPEDHIYPFNLDVPEGKRAHSNGVRNTNYMKQWIELLGKGN